MAKAIICGSMSKDPSTQVGACIVNEDNRVISVGYNGTPIGWPNDEFPWQKNAMCICEKCKRPTDQNATKYPYVVHAEMNAILNYDGSGKDFENSTVYVTLFPCSNCAKFLSQRGIKKVVYLSDKYKDTPDNIAAKILFQKVGIEVVQFNSDVKFLGIPLEPDSQVDIEKGISRVRK